MFTNGHALGMATYNTASAFKTAGKHVAAAAAAAAISPSAAAVRTELLHERTAYSAALGFCELA